MTILYSCIARGSTVLCSYHDREGSYEDVLNGLLPSIKTHVDTKTTYASHSHSYHCMVDNGLIYICAADPSFGKRQPYAFLSEVKRRFMSGSLSSRALKAGNHELDRDFGFVLSSQMEKFSSGQAGGNDNITALQTQVDDVKVIMTDNIEKVIQRAENLEELVDKTTELEASSAAFQKTARRIQKKYFWKNKKMCLILIVVVIVVIGILTLIILFSTGILPGGDSDSTTVAPTTKSP